MAGTAEVADNFVESLADSWVGRGRSLRVGRMRLVRDSDYHNRNPYGVVDHLMPVVDIDRALIVQ